MDTNGNGWQPQQNQNNPENNGNWHGGNWQNTPWQNEPQQNNPGQGNPWQNGQRYQLETPPVQKNAMSTAASVMGVLTVVSTFMFTVYVPFITGGLAILFALLSRGKKKKLDSSAFTGVTAGVVGMVLNVALLGTVWYLYTSVPEIHDEANRLFEQRYGYTIDEMIEDIIDEYR